MTGTWYDDDDALLRELQQARSADAAVPAVPGHDDLRELARGGQGIVYTAVQRATHRVVAIKVLRAAPAERDRRRFERELDLVATLKHPNVVAVYDGGTCGDGRPFLVMELVNGPTIDFAPCVVAVGSGSPTRAQIAAIVELVAATCDGVAYAHRHGVVHRDLKPSNVRIDADGTPKVLDFGLAKNLSLPTDDLTVGSAGSGGRFLGSLPWVSPEQAQGRVEDVDVRSDVYSLGLILYRLLVGRFPYDVDTDLPTTLRAIVEASPLPPRRVLPAIASDLETILLRALHKDPERRYQSAGELAADLRAFLTGAPVAARRDSAWYVLRRTARRHRAVFALAALTAASLALGLVVALVLWRRAEDGRRQAVDSARRADAAMRYFADTLMAVDPDHDGADVKVVDLLHRAARDLETRFADDPESKYFFLVKLAGLYTNLSALPEAERQAAAAVTTAVATWGEADARTLFAHAAHGLALHRQGRDGAALGELQAAAATTDVAGLARTAGAAHVFMNLGLCLQAGNDVDAAERALRRAAAVILAPEDDKATQVHNAAQESLAAIAHWRGRTDEAIALMREVAAARGRDLGPEHSATLRSASNLAYYLAESGRTAEAEATMARNLEACRRHLGPRSIETLTALNNHAQYLKSLHRDAEAESELRECLAGRRQVLGDEHPHTLVTWTNLAACEEERGDFGAAAADLRQVIAIRTRTLGAAHADTLVARNNLAHLLADEKNLDAAIAELRGVVTAAEASLGAEHWMTALFRCNLGADLLQQGDHAGAEPLLRDALRVLEQKRGKEHADTRGARRRLAELLRATGRADEAATLTGGDASGRKAQR